MKRRDDITILYGAAVTDRIYEKRQLVLRNAPGTQRMTRILSALRSVGRKCFVLTPAIQPRIRSRWKLERPMISRQNGVPIIAIRQVWVKIIGYLLAPIFAILAARRINQRHVITTIIQYNFHPDVLAFGLWCKYVYGSHLILEVEDISKISWRDWLPHSEIRAFNQTFTYFLQQIAFRCCDAIFAPSAKFLSSFPVGKKALVVRGCQKVVEKDVIRCTGKKISILLSGSLTLQNGLGLFFDTLSELDEESSNETFSFDVCGVGRLDYARMRAKKLKHIHVNVLGTLTNLEFAVLYDHVDVCLVLQDPNGRFGVSKSPSKGYEALCSGKTIVVTDIGDFGDLPEDVCYHLRKFSVEELSQILKSMTPKQVFEKRLAAIRYARGHYDLPIVGRNLGEL